MYVVYVHAAIRCRPGWRKCALISRLVQLVREYESTVCTLHVALYANVKVFFRNGSVVREELSHHPQSRSDAASRRNCGGEKAAVPRQTDARTSFQGKPALELVEQVLLKHPDNLFERAS